MKDACSLTVLELKEKLKTLKQNTTGTRAESIRRLMDADPSVSWMDDVASGAAVNGSVVDDACGRTSDRQTCRSALTDQEQNAVLQREMELCRREKELAVRELEITRRELDLLRRASAAGGAAVEPSAEDSGGQRWETTLDAVSKVNIVQIADLLGIPDPFLRDQARIQRFDSAAEILRAFEDVSLHARNHRGNPSTGEMAVARSGQSSGSRARNDRVCYSCVDLAEGLKSLEIVLNVASQYGLQINWKKSCFLQSRVEYLGHIVENGSVRPSTHKTKAVEKFPKPGNVKQVQSFLGLTGPLTNLLRASVPFIFGEKEVRAFEALKMALTEKPVLHLYNVKAETELHTDACMYGFGAILLQRDSENGSWHPVYYASSRTTSAEEQYTSYELEVLAVVKALKKFRDFDYTIV
ncbi:uncharacterized protein LOC109862041 [Pseudomyrmex gracilis]|uniref:uncharacterized protein LOC109862041 n=1 Tax=Pseudomyrmex gracilis TaxID=219809 RepID=UPI000994E046|nr:uncharacterized protein LOC109862041 [Pseudomyrmex gracilis]